MSTLKRSGTARAPADPQWADRLLDHYIGTVAVASHRRDLADDMEYALGLNTHTYEPVGGTSLRRGQCGRCRKQRGWREHLTPHAVSEGAVSKLREAEAEQ